AFSFLHLSGIEKPFEVENTIGRRQDTLSDDIVDIHPLAFDHRHGSDRVFGQKHLAPDNRLTDTKSLFRIMWHRAALSIHLQDHRKWLTSHHPAQGRWFPVIFAQSGGDRVRCPVWVRLWYPGR